LRGGAKEFILVDAEKGTRRPAFDHEKLAAALSKAAGEEFKADHLPFSDIEFVDDNKAVKFDAASKSWKCDLTSYECTAIPTSAQNLDSRTPTVASSTESPLASEEFSSEDAAFAGESSASFFAEEQTQSQQQDQSQQGRGQGRGAGRGRGQGGGGG